MVHNEINITCKDDPTDYGTRREKKRGQMKKWKLRRYKDREEREKEMIQQHNRKEFL